MRTKLHILLVGGFCALLPVSAFAEFTFLGGVAITDGAEILSFDKSSDSLLSTYSSATGHGVRIYTLSSTGQLTTARDVDLSAQFGGGAANVFSLSSVVADSQGRDFGVASLIPTDRGATTGKAVFFQLSTGTVLSSVDVGFHPDSVTITPDGNRIVIANEGEFINTTTQTPGSISVINLAGVTNMAGISALTNSAVTTRTFEAANLGAGVSIADLRNNRDTLATPVTAGDRYLDVEPEYITTTNTKAYVSLQEANAVAVYDFAEDKIVAIHDLGAAPVRLDATDRELGNPGPKIEVNDTVAALRMPDTLAQFEREGETYLITTNEGDFRPDDADRARIADLGSGGRPAIDSTVKADLDTLYGGNIQANSRLGRLRVSTIDGDTDNDGDIDVLTTISSRGISIINGNTGELAFDSGSMIEDYVAENDPLTFNINAEALILDAGTATLAGLLDGRSPDKGPEIEAVAFGSLNGRDYAFAAAERQNGIFAFDITDFENVQIVDYFNFINGTTDTGYIAPESLLFVSAEDSPTGEALLIAGFEISGSIAVFGLGGLSAIPEPASAAAQLGVGALGLVMLRRRRRAG
jgi:hypothetical protein